jgi:thiamine biosynthesis protein ThiS
VRIRLNGCHRDVEDAMTVDALVEELDLDRSVIAIELNRAVVSRAAYGSKRLSPGDEIEIVTLVGGG